MKCKTHPTYKALKPPASCIYCLVLYQQKQIARLEDEMGQLQSAVLECAEVANSARENLITYRKRVRHMFDLSNRF